jgi:hypothetical protein
VPYPDIRKLHNSILHEFVFHFKQAESYGPPLEHRRLSAQRLRD